MQGLLSIITIGLFIASGPNALLSQPAVQAKSFPCPDEHPTTGFYRNYSYGFSVQIPRGLKGFWNSVRCFKDKSDCVCLGDHGRFIPINSSAHLEIMVGPQNGETSRESIEEEIAFRLQTHEEENEKAETVIRSAARLHPIRATRLKLQYRAAKTGTAMIDESIVCAPSSRGFVYSVYLITPQDQYRKNKRLMDRLTRSWRFRRWR